MNENDDIIKELNSFLKGINMGSDAFETYQEKTKNSDLKHQFKKIIHTFASHKKIVVSYIEKLGGEPRDSLGITGEVASTFEKVKDIFMDKDDEFLTAAIKAMDMGVKGGSKAVTNLESTNVNQSIISSLKDMLKQYDIISNNLKLFHKKISINQ